MFQSMIVVCRARPDIPVYIRMQTLKCFSELGEIIITIEEYVPANVTESCPFGVFNVFICHFLNYRVFHLKKLDSTLCLGDFL